MYKPPKIKEEPLSDTEVTEFGGFDVKLEVKTEVMDEPQQIDSRQSLPTTPVPQLKRLPCDITDEKFKVPFKFGWKRELVYRSQMPDTRTKSDKAEVYYITPEGKKLRTKNEIQLHLSDGLDVNMFTFTKEPLGASVENEIVRSAKAYTPHTQRKVVPNFLDIGESDPSLGFGKRVPKPKMPKGASPPPGNRVMLQCDFKVKLNRLMVFVSRMPFQPHQIQERPVNHRPTWIAKMLRRRNRQS